ncbi:hypothetical protein GB937_005122 [Aspergillus fischeri]|nr:hypothetical protein GB937_005122 [Aspergillus fischeri]
MSSSWWRADKFGNKTWVALFSSWTKELRRGPSIGRLAMRGRGKYLVMWDCDHRPPYTDSPRQDTKQPHGKV